MKKRTIVIILIYIFLLFFGVLYGAIPASERAALIALYTSTNGDHWVLKNGWKTAPLDIDGFAMPGTEGSWVGIQVVTDHVTEIFFVNNNLNGSIPSQLGNLGHLILLELTSNGLIGSIPPQLGNLDNLTYLCLNSNNLSGNIPSELSNLSNMRNLALSHNQLSGNIPSQLSNLGNLTNLDLSGNQLNGNIPSQLSLLIHLTALSLSHNQLSGSILPELGNLNHLNHLTLSYNQLSGSIPAELGNLSNLQGLYLNTNQLSGSIPVELGNLQNLRNLSLFDNQLSGSIPAEFKNLGSLKFLFLNNNQLSGDIPSEFGNIHSLMRVLLNNNRLQGEIPTSITNLSKVQDIDIGYNCLSATNPDVRTWLNNYDLDWETHQDECTVVAIVTTDKVSSITPNSAIGGGNISSDGGAMVTARGVCWSTTINPNLSHSKTNDGTGTGHFTSHISGLNANTLYYVRAYASNSKGTAYGINLSFTTLNIVTAPTVKTEPVSSITASGAIGGGNVTSDGRATVTARGVCWSTAPNPNTNHAKTSDGAGTGYFTTNITGLSANRLYYVRAYATNSMGTAYGANVNFTTQSNLTEMDPPFGSFDTPFEGSTVSGSIAITGWTLDDGGLDSVKIYFSQGNTPTYVGEVFFVEGARPDVAVAYPEYPGNTKAGWGYLMLTHSLPGEGNGPFVLSAVATDKVGKTAVLGTKTIMVDNAHAIKPFGTLDTPFQGGIASGSRFANWGWVLTPQPNSIPTDGSTITVWVDGVNIGNPVYNLYREDIAMLFPGYANSNGAVGYFELDTTKYTNGLHTIQWVATDSAGNRDGIGSRYFSIHNEGANGAPMNLHPITFTKGFHTGNPSLEWQPLVKDNNPLVSRELESMEIHLGEGFRDIQGYLFYDNELKNLPFGSALDKKNGVFSWSPGPGFIGRYVFVFVLTDANGQAVRKSVQIQIEPQFNN